MSRRDKGGKRYAQFALFEVFCYVWFVYTVCIIPPRSPKSFPKRKTDVWISKPQKEEEDELTVFNSVYKHTNI